MVIPLKDLSPELVNVMGMDVFAGVIQLKISRQTLNPRMGILIRDREEKAVWRWQQDWSEAATRNVNSHQILEEARKRRSLRREGIPADTSRTVRK